MNLCWKRHLKEFFLDWMAIKNGKKKEKIPYQHYIFSTILSEENASTSKSLTPKELNTKKCYRKMRIDEEMEWEAIEEEAYKEFEDDRNSIPPSEWVGKVKKESLKWRNHMT
ncbi:unnamed protein product [Rhizophagus irregularis]|nr:unnamed protein product [Rhizophagus irregularis]